MCGTTPSDNAPRTEKGWPQPSLLMLKVVEEEAMRTDTDGSSRCTLDDDDDGTLEDTAQLLQLRSLDEEEAGREDSSPNNRTPDENEDSSDVVAVEGILGNSDSSTEEEAEAADSRR